MSLDSKAGADAPAPLPLQYITAQIMPVAGGLSVMMQATLLDEQELEFVSEDLAHEHVSTLDQAIAVIRRNVAELALTA